jgi:hypothetical protein
MQVKQTYIRAESTYLPETLSHQQPRKLKIFYSDVPCQPLGEFPTMTQVSEQYTFSLHKRVLRSLPELVVLCESRAIKPAASD